MPRKEESGKEERIRIGGTEMGNGTEVTRLERGVCAEGGGRGGGEGGIEWKGGGREGNKRREEEGKRGERKSGMRRERTERKGRGKG